MIQPATTASTQTTAAQSAADRRLSGNKDIGTWAIDVLIGLGAPLTNDNISALVGWANHESGGYNPTVTGGLNNPLNTTEGALCKSIPWPQPGSCRNGGSQGNIKDFSTYQQGVASIVHNLQNPRFGYPAIVAALQQGHNQNGVFAAIDASQFGTKGLGPGSGSMKGVGGGSTAASGSGSTGTGGSGTVQTTGTLTDIAQGIVGNLPIIGGITSGASAAFNLEKTVLGLFLNWRYLAEVMFGLALVSVGILIIVHDTGTDKKLISAAAPAASAAAVAA